ncbi:MAG: dTDP-4-dehydrorhamnose 3,5-epimerase [bacterium]|jgi:dTDP-4-dehydrorhamnose 3,5-epimerase|nr:dTDP-4-dehydrorhamnose 3,5-epimerase [bacterium]
MPFVFQPLAIPEVILITAKQFPDDRGFFMETYKRSEFALHGIEGDFVQDNYSRSNYGVLRGLHYQKDPDAQGKLVSVLKGKIYDVAVDIRRGSPTFGRWVGVELSDERPELLWVPEGFAHGFCVLSDTVDFNYKCSGSEYAPTAYRGIAWNDPALGISWPVADPSLSERDKHLPRLEEADTNFVYKK